MGGPGPLAKLDLQAPKRALDDLQDKLKSWKGQQPPIVDVVIATALGSTQGGLLGGTMGYVTKMDPEGIGKMMQPPPGTATDSPLLKMQTQSPLVQARNFAVMTGVQAGLSLAIKHARGGVEDVRGAMGAAFGSGAAFSLVSGMSGGKNPMMGAFSTGVLFALLQGGLYQLGKKFGGEKTPDIQYARVNHLLSTVGFPKYEKHLRRAMLTDPTIMLWNDRALQQAGIPPGPRLLILHHVESFRGVLKPGLPAGGAALSG